MTILGDNGTEIVSNHMGQTQDNGAFQLLIRKYFSAEPTEMISMVETQSFINQTSTDLRCNAHTAWPRDSEFTLNLMAS